MTRRRSSSLRYCLSSSLIWTGVFSDMTSHVEIEGEGAAALWLMAERWSPAPTMVSELRGHRQPIAKFRALTLSLSPLFLLSPIRARGGRRRALADGRTMVAGADDGERATGSSPTDRQIPRTDTGNTSTKACSIN